jgi:subtilisin-like proprotein convertase family protein
MRKTLLLAILLCTAMGFAQADGVWGRPTGQVKAAQSTQRLSFPNEFKLFQLKNNSLRQALETVNDNGRQTIIELPNVNGGTERFSVREFSNFDPALQAQYPDIRSYTGTGIDDKSATIRFSVDPKGIQTMVFRGEGRSEFMEPYSEDGSVYAVFNSSRDKGSLPWVCSTEDHAVAQTALRQTEDLSRSSHPELLTFRLALSCNGEYTIYHGGTVAGALAAMNATMTRVNGVFEKDMAIHMNLIPNNSVLIYTNPLTDPYGNNLNAWNGQLQNTLTNVIGEANYDIGHMFGRSGGGGNAGCIGCVCESGKGSGITSPADGIPMGDNFDIDYVAHEMGHQFGANHTFSHGVEGTGVNVEPGSGSTIMGYAGITNYDIANHSDDYFVYASIRQVQNNMVTKTCPVRTPLTHGAPVVNAGADYIIPKSTPFVLTGSAMDPNGDALTYCWEQNDSATNQTGAQSPASATKTGGPNWRSYDPTSSPSRYFPPLARVVANQSTSTFGSVTTEALSSVARALNFVLTARDNNPVGGLTGTDAMKITVSAAAGPFLVTSPNTAVSYAAGTTQQVTWDVAGTTGNGVDAAFVDIFLSTDGGFTYPHQLAGQVPNDGSESVTIPNVPGTTNRIMVKGYNHVFFDISNTNFTITAPAETFAISSLPGQQTRSICQGSEALFSINHEALAGFNGATAFSASGQPSGVNVSFTPSPIVGNGVVTMTVTNTTSVAPGLYPITVTATSGSIVKTLPVYLNLYSGTFGTVAAVTPANNATAQSTSMMLVWIPDANATEYDVEVATDNGFTNIIASGTVVTNSYMISGLLEATNYFWRVRPRNIACAGNFGSTNQFQTGQIACESFASTNVPMPISASGTPTINSTLVIPAASNEIIADLNISVNITHSWINDLTAILIGPDGTQVQLVAAPCASSPINNIVATFDDEGSPVVCGNNPGIGGTVVPLQPLSAFDGFESAGTWTLRISDAWNLDGGSLLGWSLNVCSAQPLAVGENQLTNFVVYPNPNNGSFQVSFTQAASDDVTMMVHDMRGRKVFSKVYEGTGVFDQSVSLDNAEAGVYLLTVQTGGRKEVKRIVIQ